MPTPGPPLDFDPADAGVADVAQRDVADGADGCGFRAAFEGPAAVAQPHDERRRAVAHADVLVGHAVDYRAIDGLDGDRIAGPALGVADADVADGAVGLGADLPTRLQLA